MTIIASATSYQTTQKSVTVTGNTVVDFVLPRVAAAPAPQGQCDASLWPHVHDPARLQILQSCITVTGVLMDHHESDDGDVDMQLAVDSQFANLLNSANMAKLQGHLQTEAICQVPIHADVPNAMKSCGSFKGSLVLPPVGTYVQITGTYLIDHNHGWAEIHPISVITPR